MRLYSAPYLQLRIILKLMALTFLITKCFSLFQHVIIVDHGLFQSVTQMGVA
jgi:hypothetical protein